MSIEDLGLKDDLTCRAPQKTATVYPRLRCGSVPRYTRCKASFFSFGCGPQGGFVRPTSRQKRISSGSWCVAANPEQANELVKLNFMCEVRSAACKKLEWLGLLSKCLSNTVNHQVSQSTLPSRVVNKVPIKSRKSTKESFPFY